MVQFSLVWGRTSGTQYLLLDLKIMYQEYNPGLQHTMHAFQHQT